jgi:CheY-like chemotaxis protein
MKVLIIEDDLGNQELLRLRLEALDCQVRAARRSEDGLRLARSSAPGLILLDMRLEEEQLAGAQVLRTLRADDATAGIPVAIHSIFVDDDRELFAELPPADAYLPKPFKLNELRAIVDRFRPAITIFPAAEAAEEAPKSRRGCWWPEAL